MAVATNRYAYPVAAQCYAERRVFVRGKSLAEFYLENRNTLRIYLELNLTKLLRSAFIPPIPIFGC